MSCDIGEAMESLENEQSSFSKLSVTSPTSQLTLQPFPRFTYVTALLILKAFNHFTYVTAHSPTFPSLYLRYGSFSNPSVASPMSQFILQPFFRFSYVTSRAPSPIFRRFTYVTAHSPTLLSLVLRHRLFTWRAAHGTKYRYKLF